MSSASTPPTTSSPSPASTGTSSPSNNGGGTSFFGIFIAFVGLVIVFMLCGLGSRWRFVARRRAVLANIDPWPGAFAPQMCQAEPKYREPLLAPAGGDWSTITPLSISVLHNETEAQQRREAPPEAPPHTFSLFPLSSWIPFVRANPTSPRRVGKLPEGMGGHQTEKPPDHLEVQVGVIIILPSVPRVEESDRQILPEYRIGTMRVLWEGGPM